MPLVGAPRLQHFCIALLIDFRDYLEDIGDIPLELLQPVLLRCYAEQLAAIEDGTRKGLYLNRASYTKTYVQMDFVSLHRNGGRELHEALQPHWQRVYTAEFGNGSCASSQGSQHLADSTHEGVTRDWRQLYEVRQQALQQKAVGLGKRLRAMTEAEDQSRQTRNVEIIDAPPALKKHRSSNGRGPSKPQVQINPARQRVLSKLGLLHSHSLKQLVQIRPKDLAPLHKALQSPGQHSAAANHSNTKNQPVRGMDPWQDSVRATDSRQQSVSSHQGTVKRHTHLPQAAKLSTVQTHLVMQQASHRSQKYDNRVMANRGRPINTKQDAGVQAPVQRLKRECASSGQLVEDDIDWGASDAPQTTAASPPPVAEQPWTVQYLEGHDEEIDAARDRMLGRRVSQSHPLKRRPALSSDSNTCGISGDIAPVKHGTGVAGGWVENEIEWD